ncbi:Tyrosine recombinase XerD [Serratia proteamaculans]|nr:Tyrosine recombinase XerD [Serratia proteamaculans]
MVKQRKYLTRNEIEKILRAAVQGRHPQRDACLLKMCFIHGFRVSELVRLTLSDINLEAGIVHVRRLKNGFSTTHPLTQEELPYLHAWLAQVYAGRPVNALAVFIAKGRSALSAGGIQLAQTIWPSGRCGCHCPPAYVASCLWVCAGRFGGRYPTDTGLSGSP